MSANSGNGDRSVLGIQKRPLLLGILCTGTWLLCLWLFVTDLRSIFTDEPWRDRERDRDELALRNERLEEELGRPVTISLRLAEEKAAHAVPLGWISLTHVTVVACSAWMIWRLKKVGLWLFIAVQFPALVLPFLWISVTLSSLLGYGFRGFLWAGITTLFALNIKHLR